MQGNSLRTFVSSFYQMRVLLHQVQPFPRSLKSKKREFMCRKTSWHDILENVGVRVSFGAGKSLLNLTYQPDKQQIIIKHFSNYKLFIYLFFSRPRFIEYTPLSIQLNVSLSQSFILAHDVTLILMFESIQFQLEKQIFFLIWCV